MHWSLVISSIPLYAGSIVLGSIVLGNIVLGSIVSGSIVLGNIAVENIDVENRILGNIDVGNRISGNIDDAENNQKENIDVSQMIPLLHSILPFQDIPIRL